MALGRPFYLHGEDNDVPLPIPDNFSFASGFKAHDEQVVGGGRGELGIWNFIGMAQLSTIISDILRDFYSLREMRNLKSLDERGLLGKMQGFKVRLDGFKREVLDRVLRMGVARDLLIAVWTVEIVLYRAVLRNLGRECGGYEGVRMEAGRCLLGVLGWVEGLDERCEREFWLFREFFSFFASFYSLNGIFIN